MVGVFWYRYLVAGKVTNNFQVPKYKYVTAMVLLPCKSRSSGRIAAAEEVVEDL